MPLPDFTSTKYLDRHRVFVSSDNKRAEGQTFWDGLYSIGKQLRDVVSIEVVGYNIPRSIFPTFVAESRLPDGTLRAGNNKLDVRVTDVPVTQSLTFTVTFPEGVFSSLSVFSGDISQELNDAMDAAGDPVFNTSNNYAFVNTSTGNAALSAALGKLDGTFTAPVFRYTGDASLASSEFLFGTGENAANSAWKVLGYDQGVDSGGPSLTAPGTTFDPIPVRATNTDPFTYVDVVVAEARERNPVKRIFTQELGIGSNSRLANAVPSEYVQTANGNRRWTSLLLIDNPIRQLKELNISLEFQDGAIPPVSHQLHYDLILDLIYLTPESEIPDWVQQTFTL